MGGGAHVFELGHGEIAAKQAEATVGGCDQAFGVNMIERLAEAFADIVNRLNLAFRDRYDAKNNLRRWQALE